MKRYKPRHKELTDYVDNNEAIEAQVGSTILISLEDVDIIIDRVKNSVVLADVLKNEVAVCKHDWYGIDQIHSKCRNCGRIERDD